MSFRSGSARSRISRIAVTGGGIKFRSAQEIEISRRIQPQIPHTVRMHHDIVEVPQIDVRQVLRQNALHLGIQRLSHLWIDLAPCLIDQRVDIRIRVVVAVRPIRRKLRRVKRIFKDIRIFVPADPAQPVHLKRAMLYVGKERCELEAPDIKHDSDIA